MPAIYYRPSTRRQFLTHVTHAAGALALVSTGAFTARAAEKLTFRLALLSDTHIAADPKDESRKFLPTENLKKAVAQVMASRPEGALINGDLARLTGEPGDYDAVKQLLQPLSERLPVYLSLGNHDDRTNFTKAFTTTAGARQSVTDRVILVIEQPVVRIIMLDSLLYPNKTPGLLGKPQREWLARYLTDSDTKTTILFVHHTLKDGDGDLLDVDRLFDVIRPHRKVKAIFYGHSHEYNFTERDGVHLVNIPSVGYNFNDKEPVGWVDASFTTESATLKLHAIGGNLSGDGQSKTITWKM